MKIFSSSNISREYKRSSLAIGNFDGVHKGHQKVFRYAKKNAKRNKVNNINFFCGDLKDILRKDDSLSSIPKPDIIIIDPPRAGMHKKTIKDIIKFKPKKNNLLFLQSINSS